jgi:hypothetical protein
MAENKTQKTKASVSAFLNAIEDDQKRKDAKAVHKMMREATGARAAMWGAAIVGYGSKRYAYASGRTGDWFQVGFSPRKQALTLYIMDGFREYAPLLKKLGKHKTGKSCLYVKRLSDVDEGVLRELIERSVKANA